MLQELAVLKLSIGSKRDRRIKKEGSEDIVTELKINPNDFAIVDYEQHEVAKRYLPLDEVVTINTGSVPVKVLYNQNDYDTDIVPAGGVIKVEKDIRSLKVINLDSTNQADVIIKAKRKPMTMDEAIRSLIP
ncbi:hypothetical protein [Geoglobus ahangari]